MTNLDVTYSAHRRQAVQHPVKASRWLARIEAALSLKVHAESERLRLEAACRGIRAGLGDGVRCEDCGHALEDELSKERRCGPDCWAKRERRAS